MLTLDLRTAILSQVSTDATCALVMSVLWWQNRNRYSGLALWLADSVLKILGLGLILLRGHIPDLLSVAVSNTLIIASAVALLEGLRRFFGTPAASGTMPCCSRFFSSCMPGSPSFTMI